MFVDVPHYGQGSAFRRPLTASGAHHLHRHPASPPIRHGEKSFEGWCSVRGYLDGLLIRRHPHLQLGWHRLEWPEKDSLEKLLSSHRLGNQVQPGSYSPHRAHSLRLHGLRRQWRRSIQGRVESMPPEEAHQLPGRQIAGSKSARIESRPLSVRGADKEKALGRQNALALSEKQEGRFQVIERLVKNRHLKASRAKGQRVCVEAQQR